MATTARLRQRDMDSLRRRPLIGEEAMTTGLGMKISDFIGTLNDFGFELAFDARRTLAGLDSSCCFSRKSRTLREGSASRRV